MSRRSVLPQFDVAAVDYLYPLPPGAYVGGGSPHIARRSAPAPRFAEAPFAYREQNGFDGFARPCRLLFSRLNETTRHMTVLYRRTDVAVGHGIAEFDGVPARFQVDYRLEARGEIENFLPGEINAVRLFAVDLHAEVFFVGAVFPYVDREDVFARFVNDNVVEQNTARPRVHTGHVLTAAQTLVLHTAGEPLEYGVGNEIFSGLAAALFRNVHREHERRVGRHFLVVTEIVFEIFQSPFRNGARVGEFAPEAGGQVLAGKSAVGGINADFEPESVYLFHQCGNTLGETDKVALPLSVLVTHIGVPVVVEVDIGIARVGKSRLLESDGGVVDEILVYVVAEGIPTRPPHKRRFAYAVLIGGDDVLASLGRAAEQFANITERAHLVAFCHNKLLFVSVSCKSDLIYFLNLRAAAERDGLTSPRGKRVPRKVSFCPPANRRRCPPDVLHPWG